MDFLTCLAFSTVIGGITYIYAKESSRKAAIPQATQLPKTHNRLSLYYAPFSRN